MQGHGGIDRDAVARSLKAPAILLLVTAALGALAAAGSLVAAQTVRESALSAPDLDEQGRRAIEWMFGTGAWILHGWGFGVAVICVLGALSMLNLRSRGLAIAAAILVMTIPSMCCCVPALLPGIWSLVVLFRPETAAAFAAPR